MDGKYALKITSAAYDDIDEVLGYISGSLANPDAAADLLEELEKKA